MNPKVEVVMVMLIIPFFINVSIYINTAMSVSHPVLYAVPCTCVLLHAQKFCCIFVRTKRRYH
jgi:hypothetical protein